MAGFVFEEAAISLVVVLVFFLGNFFYVSGNLRPGFQRSLWLWNTNLLSCSVSRIKEQWLCSRWGTQYDLPVLHLRLGASSAQFLVRQSSSLAGLAMGYLYTSLELETVSLLHNMLGWGLLLKISPWD